MFELIFNNKKATWTDPDLTTKESCLLDQLIKGICHSRIVSGWTWVSTVSPEWKGEGLDKLEDLATRIGSSKSLQTYSFLPVEEPVESEGL